MRVAQGPVVSSALSALSHLLTLQAFLTLRAPTHYILLTNPTIMSAAGKEEGGAVPQAAKSSWGPFLKVNLLHPMCLGLADWLW